MARFDKKESAEAPLTTLTLFGYDSNFGRLWAFSQMGLAGLDLKKIPGLQFWKLLGSGEGGGFSIKPNWSRYGLLCVWETRADADAFFTGSELMRKFRRRAAEIWTVYLLPVRSHGNWAGANPFEPSVLAKSDSAVAVLTRATIRLPKLYRFWSFVPRTSREIERAEGLIASIGVGEAPLLRQATFSLWQSEKAMRDFSYKNAVHAQVIKLTRAENWYAEELFARFTPIASEGIWNGRDPLKNINL